MGYVAKVWEAGNSLVITIPQNQLEFFGIKLGDKVEVYLKKRE